ncbi:DUF262 domain-containing protein [Variovorax sp. AB1(2024)]|uniref:GmrSD restriction endonuclease domain-containing protein n=1 Tax=Variovorax sp. AB1(2024) TaxID=3132214 RepID=UPI00309C2FD2
MTIVSNMITESRPIKWVFDEFKKGNLYVDESFQRNFTWIRKDKISLLETIILGYPIPEIYLWETSTDPTTGDTKYSVIDGQQRIRTLGLFIDGDLKLTDSGLEFSDAAYRGKSFEDLSSAMRSDIWSYKISIRFVNSAVHRDDIVKMFLRLNKTSNALNPQELRNAEFNGEFLKASERVAQLEFWRRWNLFSDTEIRRMQDIQFASTLLIFIRSGFEDETTQSAINKMYDLYNDSYPQIDADIASIEAALSILNELLARSAYLQTPWKKKTHLYTVFTVAAWLAKMNMTNWDAITVALDNWFMWTELNDVPPEEYTGRLYEYHRLSQEGVQKKANRLARFAILTEYLQEVVNEQPQAAIRSSPNKYEGSSFLNPAEPHEIEYWSKTLGVTEDLLRETINSVGPQLNAIRQELGKKA